MAAPPANAPVLVRIKRKRDELPLEGFTLGNKRPNLTDLSIGADATAAAPAAMLYRLKRPADDHAPSMPINKSAAACSSAAPEASFGRDASKHRRVVLRRADGASTGAAPVAVLELTTAPKPPPAPKLRPFGPPLPPSNKQAKSSTIVDGVPLDDLWADAAAAAALGDAEVDPDEQYVYDEYEPMGASVDGAAGDDATPHICWEELDDDLLGEEPDAFVDGDGSDSQGEVDYPDESDDGYCSADSDDNEERYWR